MSPRARKLVSGLVGVAVLAPAFIWWESHKKSQMSSEVKAVTLERLSRLGHDEAGSAYYQGLVEAFHESAFGSAYSMGGRRRSANFDEPVYYERLLTLMAAKAGQDGRSQEATALQVTKISLMAAAAESSEPPGAE